MFNAVRMDIYRLIHTKSAYVILVIAMALAIAMSGMNLIIKGKHKKTLIFPVFSGDSVLYSDSCLVVIWVL